MPGWIVDLIPLAPWLAAVALLAWVGAKAFPWVRKFMHFIDDVVGEPARPGVPARPGLMERFQAVELKQNEHTVALAEVRHEVTTNHGSSLKDSTKRLEGRVEKVEGLVSELHEKFAKE